jgi:transcriptional regulator with XRE-family HTH domain
LGLLEQHSNEQAGSMLGWDGTASSYIEIGKRLIQLRRALDLTQKQIANALNMTVPRWANYELGTSRIPVDEALKLVRLWGVSLDWVYYGNRAMMPQRLIRQINAVAPEPHNNRSGASKAERKNSWNSRSQVEER